MVDLSLTLPKLNTPSFNFGPPAPKLEAIPETHDEPKEVTAFDEWLPIVTPVYTWDWDYLTHIRAALARVTSREVDRLMIFCPPRHGKSAMTTVRYPVWRLEG